MNDNQTACQVLGEAILEQVLVRAGIMQGKNPGARTLQLALEFEIRPDADSDSVLVSCERIGAAPLELQMQLRPRAS